jgi:ribulose 1,5-bisphosphate synthetase/thiazole synthase
MTMAKQPGIPVIGSYDVIVIGGASGGVAAAAAAARSGSRVFLAAAETYLGEDICATGQLWLPPDVPLSSPLARDLFADAAGVRLAPVRPLDVKRRLDAELLDAGVTFLFGCSPADLLLDATGHVAGVVLACKSGLFAVRGSAIIDATPQALLARVAGVPFTPWTGGEVTFSRIVLGARAACDDGSQGRLLPGAAHGEHAGQAVALDAFEYTRALHLAAWNPTTCAAAEQTFRDQTWHKDQAWSSDRLACVPPMAVATGRSLDWPVDGQLPLDAFTTTFECLFVVGPCAAVTRAAAARLLLAPHAIAAGERVGAHAAALSKARAGSATRVQPLHPRATDKGVREPCICERFMRDCTARIDGAAGAELPVLGTFDVVVVGGGTGGAPAAIAAARAGARVLLLEAVHGLGGVGTLGCISYYYHGYRGGFTEEITQALRKIQGAGFEPHGWNSEHKAEWFRSEILKAGGVIWFGSIVSGAVMSGKRVAGVVANTPWGRGIIRANAVIDATGNADVAAAAGAACSIVSTSDLACQGSGLPSRPFKPSYHNTDYTFIDDSDPVDLTRAFTVARRKFGNAFDLAQITDTRERRQIVGDVTITPLDVYTGRTWHDTICLSRSNFDSHGFTVHPIFFVLPPDRTSLDAWLPLRALLPRGIDGLLVTGLAISGQRDVMPVLRMQPDIQNHAYAAGLAAALAAAAGTGNLRGIDLKALQRKLVAKEIIPQDALLHRERRQLPSEVVETAGLGELGIHAELAALMSRPDIAISELESRLPGETSADVRIQIAKLLAVLGNAAGEQVLLDTVAATGWDKGWNYTGMGQFGRSLSPIDDCIVCLAALKSARAQEAVRAKAAALDGASDFSHFRAVAIYAEALGGEAWAGTLAAVLAKPGIAGHAWARIGDELADIPKSSIDTRTRNDSLRELYVARALYRCGDRAGAGERVLRAYAQDLRGHFARHASVVLRERG